MIKILLMFWWYHARAVQRCSLKMVFLKISQNSQENTSDSVSFWIKWQALHLPLIKKRLWHWCFPVNFAKCSRTTFYRTHPVASSVKIKNSSNHWKIWDRESCKQKQLPNSLMESKYTILLPKAMSHQLLPHI